MENLIIKNIDIWTTAQIQKNGAGRGNGSANQSLYGIKKLRELILELAVRGKLVPQDPNDEPARVLLEKIAKEKARLIKEGKIKKQEPLPEISEEEKLFELCDGWAWVRISDIAQHNSGKTLDSGRNSGTLREYITTSNVYWGFFVLDGLRQMPFKDDEIEKCTAKKFDLLICEGGEAGRAAVWNYSYDICFQNHIHRVRLYGYINSFYVYRVLQKLSYTGEIDVYRKGVGISNMSGKSLASIILPLPPLTEQHRIVAKVDELMTLCDRLEQQQTESNTTHQTLVETLLSALTTAANPDELSEAWQRIAEYFDTLFTTEQSIDQLKQTILQLAVMGKLVPQDPKDEPASVLLEKIAKEKARLIKEGKIKKEKPLSEIGEDEKPFELPQGWVWITLSHLGDFAGGKTPSKSKSIYWNGDISWVTPKDMKVPFIFDTEDHVTSLAIGDGLALYDAEAILFVVRSGILRRSFPVAIAKAPCTVNQDLKVLSLYLKEISQYILLMMNGFEAYILKKLTKTGMTVESIMFDEFSRHYFMIPPLAEQHRIVAKVDELMALCDALKTRLQEAQTTQIQLADVIVEQAVA